MRLERKCERAPNVRPHSCQPRCSPRRAGRGGDRDTHSLEAGSTLATGILEWPQPPQIGTRIMASRVYARSGCIAFRGSDRDHMFRSRCKYLSNIGISTKNDSGCNTRNGGHGFRRPSYSYWECHPIVQKEELLKSRLCLCNRTLRILVFCYRYLHPVGLSQS